MNQTIKVIELVLPVVVMLGIGMLSGKRKIFTREGVDAIKKLAVNISLPAVIFSAFIKAEYNARSIVIPFAMFSICFLAMGLGYLVYKLFPSQSKYLPFLTTGFEAGMLGYTLYAVLYGSDVSVFALVDLGQVLFIFTAYKILVTKVSKKETETSVFKDIFSSPIIIAIILGIILGATGIYKQLTNHSLNGLIDATAAFVAAPTGALILFAIGYDLLSSPIYWGQAISAVLIRVFIMGICVVLLLNIFKLLFTLDLAVEHAIVLMFLLPPPFVLPIFADDEKERGSIASALSLSTIVTLLAFVVLASVGV